jgi:hypothetical protein
MPYYFMRDTPLQALEQLMMSQPGQKPRGGGIYRSPFHYTPKDVACEYCQNYDRKHPCRLCECTCLEERIEAGVLELNEFVRDCFAPSMGPQLRKRMHQQFRERNLNSSCPMPTGEDGHTGGNAAGVCLTGTKRPSSCSRHTRAFGAGWSGNAGTTVLTSKASGSEGSSRSSTASTRRRRPLRSAAAISLLRPCVSGIGHR